MPSPNEGCGSHRLQSTNALKQRQLSLRKLDQGTRDQPGVCSVAVTWEGTSAGHGHIDVILLEEEALHAASAVLRAGLTPKDHGSLDDFHRVEGVGLPARYAIDATFAAAPGEGQLAREAVLVFINAVE